MDEEIAEIAEEYDVDYEEAEEIRDLVDELGIDVDDAHMILEEGI